MGYRYVWEVFKLETEIKTEQAVLPLYTRTTNFDPAIQPTPVGNISKYYETGSYGSEEPGFKIPSFNDGKAESLITGEFKKADELRYFFPPVSEVYNPFILKSKGAGWWYGTYAGGSGNYKIGVRCLSQNNVNSSSVPCDKLSLEYTKGDSLNSFRTGKKKDEYPSNGIATEFTASGGYIKRWMVYQGCDIIDAQTVQYSPENAKAGETITLSVVLPSPSMIKFGGKLLYKLEYSTDDYTANSPDKRWETAYFGPEYLLEPQTVQILEYAKQFVARVTTSDTWGYISENPTYGATINVEKEADITPQRVYYSSNDPKKLGEKFTIYVDPSVEYGGILYYQYQYRNRPEITETSPDWANIVPITTSTSKEITLLPEYDQKATIFQARVRAGASKDFQSSINKKAKVSDWIYGPTIGVTKGVNAYIGVSNHAKSVSKIYIGVENTAREITAGYIGVNGTAKKWG